MEEAREETRGEAMQMQTRHWSTETAGPGEGLSYWVEAICEAFLEMKADSSMRRDFTGRLTQHPFGPVDLNFVQASDQQVWRTRQAIARSRQDNFYLLHVRAGRLEVEQDGRSALIRPGDSVLVDSRAPYRFAFPDGVDCLSVQIPQAWLRQHIGMPEALTARAFAAGSGWGGTLNSALGNLMPQTLPDLSLPAGLLADHLAALLTLAAGPQAEDGLGTHQQALLRRLRLGLRERSRDADIDPARFAAEHGISKRYLHLLFAAAGTSFGAALLEERLAQARALLEDPRRQSLSIAEVAWRSGFADPSHFARRFRQRHGLAPAAWRRRLHT